MQSPHDSLFRFTFGQVEHAGSLLRSLMPALLLDALDWEGLRPASETSTDTGLGQHFADRLFGTTLCAAPAAHVLFLLAHKSGPDADLVRQQTRYVVHIERQWRRDHATWPSLVPVVVHHGSHPVLDAKSIADVFAHD